jgi:hypothetical protein
MRKPLSFTPAASRQETSEQGRALALLLGGLGSDGGEVGARHGGDIIHVGRVYRDRGSAAIIGVAEEFGPNSYAG